MSCDNTVFRIYSIYFFSAAFKMIEGNQAAVQKFVYFLGNFLCLGLAVYKCQGMGLLPTTTSDWLAFVEPQKVMHVNVTMHLHIIYC